MALETLKGVTEIGGFKVLQERPLDQDGNVDWKAFDELRKEQPIYVDHNVNMISFRIQNGPIKENGQNGCQMVTMIAAAKKIIEGLNEKFPCFENEQTIQCLKHALDWQEVRTKDRERRAVEGTNQA